MRKYVVLVFVLSFAGIYASTAQVNLSYLNSIYYGERASNLNGYTDDAGREYAIVGLYGGTSIVDITDPAAPAEVQYIPGRSGIWREMNIWHKHAYVTNETGGGLQIIDLTNLPVSVDTFAYTGNGLNTAHTIFIDENGYAYVFGANINNGGATILDLNADADSPIEVGADTMNYFHDGYVHGDTLWGADIYNGLLRVVNVQDKAHPFDIGQIMTPYAFTHNCWPTPDRHYIFTTDERSNATVASYDVSDITDIKLLDQYRSHPWSGTIPHNTYWLNNFLITSYYKDGVTIVDATKPDNMVQVGWFDTSPFPASDGFAGCWGVYPFFPSGTIVASDIEEGLYILKPTYERAAYLEGSVTNESTGANIFGASVEIMGTDIFDTTTLTGGFKTGYGTEGLYDVRITAAGCLTKIYPDIPLIQAETYMLDATLFCPPVGIASTDNTIVFDAYPTVIDNAFQIYYQLPASCHAAQCSIINALGQIVKTIQLSDAAAAITIDTDFNAGCYFVQLLTDVGEKNIRVVKL